MTEDENLKTDVLQTLVENLKLMFFQIPRLNFDQDSSKKLNFDQDWCKKLNFDRDWCRNL